MQNRKGKCQQEWEMNNEGCNNINASCFVQNPLSKSHYKSVFCKTGTPYVTGSTKKKKKYLHISIPGSSISSPSVGCKMPHNIIQRYKIAVWDEIYVYIYRYKNVPSVSLKTVNPAFWASLLNPPTWYLSTAYSMHLFNSMQPCINEVIHTHTCLHTQTHTHTQTRMTIHKWNTPLTYQPW